MPPAYAWVGHAWSHLCIRWFTSLSNATTPSWNRSTSGTELLSRNWRSSFLPAGSLVLSSLFLGYTRLEFDNSELVCRLNGQAPMIKLLFTCQLFVTGLLPTGITLERYTRVIRRLQIEKNSVTLQAVRRSRKKITKTMLTLSAIYVICQFPNTARHILEVFFPSHVSLSSTSSKVIHCLVLLNSIANSFIYAIQFVNFKRELMKMHCCARRDRGIRQDIEHVIQVYGER